jgi:hypothetical protein
MNENEKAKAYDKMLEQRKKYHFKRQIRVQLLNEKAIKAGLFVTDKEVDDEIARRAKVKK